MQFSQLCSTLPAALIPCERTFSPRKKLEKFAQLFSGYNLQHGQLTFELGEAQHHLVKPAISPSENKHNVHATIRLNHPLKLLWKLYSQGNMGFAKAYIDGDIDSHDLHALLTFAYVNRHAFSTLEKGTHPLRSLSRLWHTKQHKKRHNSRKNARKNIAAHYDLGNDFYQLWLDDSMTYSAAYYRHNEQTLAQAQQEKINRIIDTLDLQAGHSVLEIGCGWGGFAYAAAQRGVSVKGLTLSQEQCHYANQRFAELPNTNSTAKAHLQDYRDEQQQYDAIVSIEMFEAVGVDYWQTYFETLHRCLKPGGKALLQIITIEGDEKTVSTYQNGSDFIQTYIFPGGVLPAKTQLRTLAHDNGFNVGEMFCFGKDYATTLAAWRQQFHAVTDELQELGYDQRFRRIWDYYLVYCQVGFEQQHLDVVHMIVEKPATDE